MGFQPMMSITNYFAADEILKDKAFKIQAQMEPMTKYFPAFECQRRKRMKY